MSRFSACKGTFGQIDLATFLAPLYQLQDLLGFRESPPRFCFFTNDKSGLPNGDLLIFLPSCYNSEPIPIAPSPSFCCFVSDNKLQESASEYRFLDKGSDSLVNRYSIFHQISIVLSAQMIGLSLAIQVFDAPFHVHLVSVKMNMVDCHLRFMSAI
jgi:hypothetical protein